MILLILRCGLKLLKLADLLLDGGTLRVREEELALPGDHNVEVDPRVILLEKNGFSGHKETFDHGDALEKVDARDLELAEDGHLAEVVEKQVNLIFTALYVILRQRLDYRSDLWR